MSSLTLDGADDIVSNTAATAINGIETVSIISWVKAASLGEASFGTIFRQELATLAFISLLLNNSTNASSLRFGATRAVTNGTWLSPANSIVLNTWQCLAATYDGSNTANDPVLYIDGTSVTVTEISTPNGARSGASDNYYVGNRPALDRTLDGQIAFVEVYNVILDVNEINQAMRRPGSVRRGLVLGLKFDVMTGSTVYDYSGNGYHGTMANFPGSPWSSESPPINGLYLPDRRCNSGYMAAGTLTTPVGGSMPFDSMTHIWLASEDY